MQTRTFPVDRGTIDGVEVTRTFGRAIANGITHQYKMFPNTAGEWVGVAKVDRGDSNWRGGFEYSCVEHSN